jgi:hypothetical protein
MAKTFGTGADPKGLVNRGVEGSGAAQIFRPSQAVQDFVTRQARGEQQKAAQKKAEAKAKAEKQKVDDKAIQDLLDVDFIGWNEKRNKQILGDFSILQDEAAQEVARGGDISQSKDLLIKKKILEQKIDLMKLERTEYSNAVKTLAQIAKNENYDPEELTAFSENIALFEQGGIGENDFTLLTPPTPKKPIDWTKEFNGAQNLLDTYTKETPQSETVIKVGIDQATSILADNPKKLKAYMKDYGFTDEKEARADIRDKIIAGSTVKAKREFAAKDGQIGRTQEEIEQNFEQWKSDFLKNEQSSISYSFASGAKFGNGTIVSIKPSQSNLRTAFDENGNAISLSGDYQQDGVIVNVKVDSIKEPYYFKDDKGNLTNQIEGYKVTEATKPYFIPYSDTEMMKHLYYNTLNKTKRLYLGEKGKEVKVQPKSTAVTTTVKTPSTAPSKPTVNKFEKYKRQ